MTHMGAVLANEPDLEFVRGGPAYRLTQRFLQRWGVTLSMSHRVVGFLAITWVPLLVFALIEGRALGSTPRESLLLDFGTYARFFLAVPLLIVAESFIGPRLTGAGLLLVRCGFVRSEDGPAFDRAIARVAKWRESVWAESIILCLAMIGAWNLTTETLHGETQATWRSMARSSTGLGLPLTGLWYRLIAVPILQFFWYRWLWRLIVWARFLWTVSRLKLELVATHADHAGGLGFLGNAHGTFGILSFALSTVLSTEVGYLIVYEKANIASFQIPFLVMLLAVELIFLGPLLMFYPIMSRTRLAWARAYTLLVVRYNRAFHAKWIEGKTSSEEPLLGSPDIQSLADLGTGFEYIKGMKLVPCSLRVATQLAIATSIPCLPLFLLVMPLNKILNLLVRAVF